MKRLLIVVQMVLVTLVGMVGVSRAADPAMQSVIMQLQTIQQKLNAISSAVSTLQTTVSSGVPTKPKMYYLTSGLFTGSQATAACTTGFHMANLFEILVPSGLNYVQDHNIALTADDAGAGPPTIAYGWVRTGSLSAADIPGRANCLDWHSDTQSDLGSIVGLSSDWFFTAPPTDSTLYIVAPWWSATDQFCNASQHVWCVEDRN